MKYLCALLFTTIVIACSGSNTDPIPYDPPGNHDAGSKPVDQVDASVPDTSVPTTCVPQTDYEFCGSKSVQCGASVGTDNCGTQRTVSNCGVCGGPTFCNNGSCSTFPCVPATDVALCATAGKDCGIAPIVDNCGTQRDAFCGPGVCGKTFACVANVCTAPACVAETNVAFCSRTVSNCGTKTAADNCGAARTVSSCGTLTFNGISGMSMAGGVPAEMAGGGTKYIEAWINPSTATTGIVQVGSTPGTEMLSLSLIGGNLAIDGSTVSSPGNTIIAIPLNTWTFVYAGVNGGTGYLGKIVNNVRTEQIMKTDVGSTHLVAGDSVVIGSSFVGQMNQIRLWSKVPNAANYHDCIPGEVGLIRQWCFREGAGATTSDSLGGVPTTLNGATWTTGVCN